MLPKILRKNILIMGLCPNLQNVPKTFKKQFLNYGAYSPIFKMWPKFFEKISKLCLFSKFFKSKMFNFV